MAGGKEAPAEGPAAQAGCVKRQGQMLTEIRDEAREARAETRENFTTVFHRVSLLEGKRARVR